MAGQTEFQFVNSTIDAPTVPQDLAIRALIRKQAMKKASAARKRDGNHGKQNLRQYPVFLMDQENVIQQAAPTATTLQEKSKVGNNGQISDGNDTRSAIVARRPKSMHSRRDRKPQRINSNGQLWMTAVSQGLTTPVLVNEYELMSSKREFDLLGLSTLATMHVSRATRSAISADAYHLVLQMRSQKQWSYLSFLPSRYGEFECLRDAADCVVARAQQLIAPRDNGQLRVVSHYVKALDSLQRALDSPKTRYTPEVLCATEILAMYEILDPSGEVGWIRHAAGAARLIQLRGAQRYKTDFEKALLMSHLGPLMTEALMANERCFLEQEAWKEVLRSIIIQEEGYSIADRSELAISLHILKSNIPGTFKDITSIICKPDPDPNFVTTLRSFTHHLRRDFLEWRLRYQITLNQIPKPQPGTIEYDKQCKLFATYLSCQIITNRLLSTICPYAERRKLETEVQNLATEMFDMELETQQNNSPATLFMAQTSGVAMSTRATLNAWIGENNENQTEDGTGRGGLIDAWRFRSWCKIIGRKCV